MKSLIHSSVRRLLEVVRYYIIFCFLTLAVTLAAARISAVYN